MKPSELVSLLQEFYRDKLALLGRHEAGARAVTHYNYNNAYQYVIGREQTQVSWLRKALADLGGAVDAPADASQLPTPSGTETDVIDEDVRLAQAFLDRWRDRVEAVTNAREKGMLRVILGETMEHKRMFEQAAAGRTDLLGRRMTEGPVATGKVVPTRWMD